MEEKKQTVTKAELAERLAAVGLSRRHARQVVEYCLEEIIRCLEKGEIIHLVGFGAFRYRNRRARTGRNPRTGESVSVPEKRIIQFRPGSWLKELVRGR